MPWHWLTASSCGVPRSPLSWAEGQRAEAGGMLAICYASKNISLVRFIRDCTVRLWSNRGVRCPLITIDAAAHCGGAASVSSKCQVARRYADCVKGDSRFGCSRWPWCFKVAVQLDSQVCLTGICNQHLYVQV